MVHLNMSPKNLTVESLNVSGSKKSMNYPEFMDLVSRFHICCVQETKIDNNDVINIPGFYFCSKYRRAKYIRKSCEK